MNTMATRGKLAEVELAYAAGIFDGEGWVIIEKRENCVKNGKKKNRNPLYHITCGVMMTDKNVIDWLHERFDGYVVKHTRKYMKPHWKDCYKWVVSCKTANEFLQLIHQYLHTKKDRAEIAMELQKSIQKPIYVFPEKINFSSITRKNLPNGKIEIGHKIISEETILLREKLYQKIRGLNQRGNRSRND